MRVKQLHICISSPSVVSENTNNEEEILVLQKSDFTPVKAVKKQTKITAGSAMWEWTFNNQGLNLMYSLANRSYNSDVNRIIESLW